MNLPPTWIPPLAQELAKPYFCELQAFLAKERQQHEIFPAEQDVFSALELTPFDDVQVVILGQDPYHDVGQAHGLSFSVRPGIKPPPSLVNIYKELQSDLGCGAPKHGNLSSWARQGVLLLNAVLTVRAHEAASHQRRGWELFTDAIIAKLGHRIQPLVFILWGKPAQAKKKLIDLEKHVVLESPHPSPLSAHRGFFGSRPFSKANQALNAWGREEIDWSLPETATDS